MKKKTIIISDRNPHIRNLLKRELEACGYTVWVGETTVNAIELCFHPSSPDLLIVDDSLQNFDRFMVIEKTGNRIPPIPVIISTFDQDQDNIPPSKSHIHTVLKQGGYVEEIKTLVSRLLKKGHQPSDDRLSHTSTLQRKM